MFVPGKAIPPSLMSVVEVSLRVKYPSGLPFLARFLALHTNIRLCWIGLPGTNALA